MKRALLSVPDLFFAPRIADVLKRLGYTMAEVDPAETAFDGVGLLVVQLEGARDQWLNLIERAHYAHVPVLAFGRHTDAVALRAARQAGATRAVPNSQLMAELPQLIEQLGTEQP
ncbi:MAG: hypothetical protein E6J26_05705 [Chloroflexi bacterium]|nr:MAG: hypothetical protein E6J26_05705 [Chloroflexota bacterium]